MPAQFPDIGFPPGSEVSLLRRICNNTALMAGGGGSGGSPVVLVAAPASSASPGATGQVAVDASYFYAYVSAVGGWRRVAINDW